MYERTFSLYRRRKLDHSRIHDRRIFHAKICAVSVYDFYWRCMLPLLLEHIWKGCTLIVLDSRRKSWRKTERDFKCWWYRASNRSRPSSWWPNANRLCSFNVMRERKRRCKIMCPRVYHMSEQTLVQKSRDVLGHDGGQWTSRAAWDKKYWACVFASRDFRSMFYAVWVDSGREWKVSAHDASQCTRGNERIYPSMSKWIYPISISFFDPSSNSNCQA